MSASAKDSRKDRPEPSGRSQDGESVPKKSSPPDTPQNHKRLKERSISETAKSPTQITRKTSAKKFTMSDDMGTKSAAGAAPPSPTGSGSSRDNVVSVLEKKLVTRKMGLSTPSLPAFKEETSPRNLDSSGDSDAPVSPRVPVFPATILPSLEAAIRNRSPSPRSSARAGGSTNSGRLNEPPSPTSASSSPHLGSLTPTSASSANLLRPSTTDSPRGTNTPRSARDGRTSFHERSPTSPSSFGLSPSSNYGASQASNGTRDRIGAQGSGSHSMLSLSSVQSHAAFSGPISSRSGQSTERRISTDERSSIKDYLSSKSNTTGHIADSVILAAKNRTPRSTRGPRPDRRNLRRTRSEIFFASWDYGNLEADFNLPNGMHISAHYDLMQLKKSKNKRRRTLRKEDSKRFPTTTINILTDLNKKLDSLASNDQDVVYDDQRRSEFENIVVAGTAEKLFSLLADHRAQDREYMDVYLATHLRFISTRSLVDKLLDHFHNPVAMLQQNHALTAEELSEYIPLIQVRIVNVFKKWLRYHYAYEFEDSAICTKVTSFIDELGASAKVEHQQWATFLSGSWKSRQTTNFDAYEFDESEAPKPITPSPTSAADLAFLDIHPTELARQITIKHMDMFQRVRNDHLLRFLKDKDDPGNPVAEISAFSDKLNNWVVYELASTPTIKKRAQVYSNFVKLCVTLKNMQNYHGAMDIYCGLSGFLVARLKKTIKSVDSSAKEKYKQLTDFFDLTGGLKNLRKHIKNATSPLIIPPSIWLHDLLMTNENDDEYALEGRSSKAEALINFEKLRLFTNTFSEVYRCQLEPYNFHTIPILQTYLSKHLITVPAEDLENMIVNLVASQEARKESLVASTSSSPSSPINSPSPSGSPAKPQKPSKGTISRKASLSQFFKGLKLAPKKEPKE